MSCRVEGTFVVAAGVLALLLTPLSIAEEPAVDFMREVRPILSQHCFNCHGPDEASRRANLSLITHDAATSELSPGVHAIVPGAPEQSELWRRINDPDDPMPPREEHNALSAEQIETLKRWIEAGASYAPHWAYLAPANTAIPEVAHKEWPIDAIDRYILARLEEESLAPAPDADRATLLRRVTYDLTGLPPTVTEIDAFLADDSSGAYARVVDRLLASPRFGERLASFWLDLVRYADSVGYHGDQEHHIWPYRDWVIGALNDNMPFDQFTIEQIAGDLLPQPNQSQLIATGYNRLLQTTHEGGLQLAEYRAIYMADRIRNVAAAWMGATMGCAQCHDHKYDPYTTRDFYAFGAFFADIDDEEHLRKPYDGLNTTPTRRTPEMRVWSEADRRQAIAMRDQIATAQAELEHVINALPVEQEGWEQALRDRLAAGEVREFVWVDDVLDTGGETKGDWTFLRDDEVEPFSGRTYRRQFSERLIQHYSVKTTRKTIAVSEGDVFFCWVYLAPDDAPTAVMLQFNIDGDWEHRAVWGSDDIPYGRRSPSWAGYRRLGALPSTGRWVSLDVAAEDVGLKPGQVVSGVAFTQFGGTVYWDKSGVRSNQIAPTSVIEALSTANDERSEEQRVLLAAHHVESSPRATELRAHVAALEAKHRAMESSLPLTMFTRALDEPRPVRVLPRGNWLDESGELVEPAVPSFLGSVEADGHATRLDLARWLITPEERGGSGGKTARVFVNRLWAMLLGVGLCPSVEDFGGQGLPPNHLQLLDRLALDFIASGWDVKALVRRLVVSRTYRQSSLAAPETVMSDPLNHLFARQSRQRLPAEMVRDTALALGGLLDQEMGGPPVKPPQPKQYYRHLNFPEREYRPTPGPEQWRRSVYVHWQRQYLHPMFLAFDAPTREECVAQRSVSNTPLAALTLLNDPSFVEAARGFAQRMLKIESDDDAERLARAMRAATGRQPTDAEMAILARLLDASRWHYAQHPQEAEVLLAIGIAERDASLESADLAAWTQVTRAILNLHETITRD